MTTDQVYNLIILDESGSMESIKRSTISGFNELVQTIKGIEKKFPGQQHFISFVTFNGLGVKIHLNKQAVTSLEQIDQSTYHPDSNTPLYDAIAISVLKLKMDLAGKENVNVLVTILTDGEENASREFTGTHVKNIIDEQIKLGWTFTYIGANQDAEKVADSLSIKNSMQFSADEAGVHKMFIKENLSRERYSEKIRNKEDLINNYYLKDDKEPETKES